MTLCKYALIVHELALAFPTQADGTRHGGTVSHLCAIARDLRVSFVDVADVAIQVGIPFIV